jgi:hypothetical protein
MNYQIALKEKGLSVDALSRKMKASIKKLEKLAKLVEGFDEANLSQEELDSLKEIKRNVAELDSEITKDVNRFDLELYNQRVERVKKLPNNNKNVSEVEETKKEEVKAKVEEVKAEPNPIIEEKLEQLKKYVEIDTSKLHIEKEEEPIEVEADEVEEFEKKAEVKPKKMSTALILMGVGAFFLTWGAVNFFKERN